LLFTTINSYCQTGKINVMDIGIRGDDMVYDEIRLDSLIQSLPEGSPFTVEFPAGNYLFHKVTGKAAAINISDRSITLRGCPNATNFIIDGGCVGISFIRGASEMVGRVEDINIRAAWKDEHDGKVDGAWGRDAGNNYKFNGINCWAQCALHNVNVSGFSGHGVCLWGDLSAKFNGEAHTLPGRIEASNGDLVFIPHDTSTDVIYSLGATIEFGAEHRRIGGFSRGRASVGYIGASDSMIGRDVTAHIYRTGIGVIADNCQISGLNNFDNNGGCGFYQVGPDANVNTIMGTSCRENGYWGFYDGSFLGGVFIGCHGTHNGTHFPDGSVGSFFTENETAPSVWLGCYSEGGNQGPSRFSSLTEIIGGLHGAGIIGGRNHDSKEDVVPVFSDMEEAKRHLKTGDKWTTPDGYLRIVR
jgi:hypothetical protein